MYVGRGYRCETQLVFTVVKLLGQQKGVLGFFLHFLHCIHDLLYHNECNYILSNYLQYGGKGSFDSFMQLWILHAA